MSSKASPIPGPDAGGSPPGARSTLTPDYQRDWPAYFDAVAGQPPRQTLVAALDAFEREAIAGGTVADAQAIDLACGSGRDTLAILARQQPRWRVLAIDAHPDGPRRLLTSVPAGARDRLETLVAPMEGLAGTIAAWAGQGASLGGPTPGAGLGLVNASFALPFCQPEHFGALWAAVVTHLRPGGRFAGQFFGDRDEWAPVRPASHHTRQQVLELLQPFEIERLEEVERDGDDAMGGRKHHHVFHVVARKR